MNDLASRLGHIALIGAGKMGEAIIAGLVDGALFAPETISAADPGEERRAYLSATYGINCFADGCDIRHPQTLILAVKPQVLREVASALAAQIARDAAFRPKRVISIAAGITTATLQELFFQTTVVRVMPNVALMVGAGVSAIAAAPVTPESEADLARQLFACMGQALVIEEKLIDAASAISGSGPAYFALFVEELTRAAIGVGLSEADAAQLSLQTLTGAARYLQITEATPSELRVAVTSPGGTTAAALGVFASDDFSGTVARAVEAAIARAKELS